VKSLVEIYLMRQRYKAASGGVLSLYEVRITFVIGLV
jgi:hypothetical protein